MTSALAAVANASVTFDVATTGTVVDPFTGNVLPRTETVTVTCYLRQGSPAITDLAGVNVAGDTFSGYAVAPQALDARVVPGTLGTLTFDGQTPARCVVQEARGPYGTTGLIGSTLQQVLGDKLQIVRYRQQA
jgi:hypothetical protein